MFNDKRDSIPINLNLDVKVIDKNGNLVNQQQKNADLLVVNSSHFLHAAIAACMTNCYNEEGQALAVDNRDYSGHASCWTTLYFRLAYKIAIGENDTPPTYTDNKLYLKYKETTALTFGALIDKDTYSEFTVEASFTCDVAKTIREVGLFGRTHRQTFGQVTGPDFVWLAARDVLSPPVEVPAGGIIVVRYTFRLGLPP